MQGPPLQILGTESIYMNENSTLRTRPHRMSARIIIPPTQAIKSVHNVTKCRVRIDTHNLLLVWRRRSEANTYQRSRTHLEVGLVSRVEEKLGILVERWVLAELGSWIGLRICFSEFPLDVYCPISILHIFLWRLEVCNWVLGVDVEPV